VVKHHDIFQGYYYLHYLGKDRKLRDQYRASPYFGACARFCQRWDQLSFDPAYPTEPLNTFLPMVREVFGRKPRDLLIARESLSSARQSAASMIMSMHTQRRGDDAMAGGRPPARRGP
jgi:predicted HD phosphohydrolase